MTSAFCTDAELAYENSRTRFEPGRGLELDDSYRLAHLPLVAPQHPRVIATKDGTAYEMGRHPDVYSLALPIAADVLEASPPFSALDAELRAAPFAHKVAWHTLGRRRERLHATVCGGLGSKKPLIEPAVRAVLAGIGPVAVEVRGVFSGNVNRGRLYLRVYPEKRAGTNVFRSIQRALGRPTTDLYVIGVWNLMDDLSAFEASALAALVERWWSSVMLQFEVTELWILAARDDLLLDGEVSERVSLT